MQEILMSPRIFTNTVYLPWSIEGGIILVLEQDQKLEPRSKNPLQWLYHCFDHHSDSWMLIICADKFVEI